MLEKIASIVRQAGKIVLEADHPRVYQKEGHANFVTQTDINVQAFLLKRLSALMPQARFFCEEQANDPLTEAPTFVIDPIDGTTNFMHARRCSCISVALVTHGRAELGVIYQPYLDEMYTAKAGAGAFLNGKKLEVSAFPMDQALTLIGTSPYSEQAGARSMALAAHFLKQTGDIRRSGSAALDLCDIAAGRAEIFWEMELNPWDFAAGSLLVAEAGGRVCAMDGAPLPYGQKSSVLATNALCYSPTLELIKSRA